MAGSLQPLDQKFAIVDRFGNPTEYFIRWAQQKQIDIGTSITLTDLQAYLDAHQIIAGVGIQFAPGPNGDLNSNPTIHADAQAILDEITATRGAVLYRGIGGWAALAPDTAGKVLSTNGAGADPSWIAAGGGGGGDRVLLDTQVVVNAASVIFNNTKITGTYTQYLVKYKNVSWAAVSVGQIQLSPDNGVTWRAANYNNWMNQYGLTTNFSSGNRNLMTTGFLVDWSAQTVTAGQRLWGEMEFFGLADATLQSYGRGHGMNIASDGNTYGREYYNQYTVAETINAIRFNSTTGVLFSGTFQLWGVP